MPAPTLPPPAAPPATGTINSINVTGFGLPGNRSLQFRIPSGAAPTAGRPLVIYLHGNGGTSEIPALLSAQTDAKGMAVVALQGLVFNGTTNWEFRMDGRYAASQAGVRPPQGPDDVQFISDVIDRATAAANPLLSTKIDPSKVFVVGYSRGAGMAFVAYADPRTKNKIAAIAPVSGTFYCDMATPNVGTFPNGSAPPADADANCGETGFGFFGPKSSLFQRASPPRILGIWGKVANGEFGSTQLESALASEFNSAFGLWATQAPSSCARPISLNRALSGQASTLVYKQAQSASATSFCAADVSFLLDATQGHVPSGYEEKIVKWFVNEYAP
jgi:predicted esterase